VCFLHSIIFFSISFPLIHHKKALGLQQVNMTASGYVAYTKSLTVGPTRGGVAVQLPTSTTAILSHSGSYTVVTNWAIISVHHTTKAYWESGGKFQLQKFLAPPLDRDEWSPPSSGHFT
jgi:hypothetical protein